MSRCEWCGRRGGGGGLAFGCTILNKMHFTQRIGFLHHNLVYIYCRESSICQGPTYGGID